MERSRLPNRRPSLTVSVPFQGHSFYVTMGFSVDGKICEVFGNAAHMDSDMDFMVSDACILISIALQNGIGIAELHKSMKMKPADIEGKILKPASLIGEILFVLEQEQIKTWQLTR